MKVKDIVVKEAVLKAYDGKQATIDDPEHGKTINLDLTKPENAASLKPNDQGQLEYDPTPEVGVPGAQPGSEGPKPGTQVTIKTDETGEFAVQDKTDQLINDVEIDEVSQNYTADELVAILSGQKTQQQIDAEKAAKTQKQTNEETPATSYDSFGNPVPTGSQAAAVGGGTSTLPAEQIAYNQLRAQIDGLDSLQAGGENTYSYQSPDVAASQNAMRQKLAQMEKALLAKGIDAKAEYDAPEPGEQQPSLMKQKYASANTPKPAPAVQEALEQMLRIAGLR